MLRPYNSLFPFHSSFIFQKRAQLVIPSEARGTRA